MGQLGIQADEPRGHETLLALVIFPNQVLQNSHKANDIRFFGRTG